MGKRSNFERNPRDFYRTPFAAVTPLLPYLHGRTFAEPCAGDGYLINHLELLGMKCVHASDIEPQKLDIDAMDALNFTAPDHADYIITNPPWDRKLLHPMIEHFRKQRPTWLLFDADWMHTLQAAPYLPYCHVIVSVGRVKWIPDSKMTGKDNCCWYLFDNHIAFNTVFKGREST